MPDEPIKRPPLWNKYRDAYNNLLYAIILQAAIDAEGYMDNNKAYPAEPVQEFIKGTGAKIYKYLDRQERV